MLGARRQPWGGGAWVGKEQPMSGGGKLADELRWGTGWADVAFRWGDAGGWGRGRWVPGPVEQAGCRGGRAGGRASGAPWRAGSRVPRPVGRVGHRGKGWVSAGAGRASGASGRATGRAGERQEEGEHKQEAVTVCKQKWRI
jgi:hypothetical protein